MADLISKIKKQVIYFDPLHEMDRIHSKLKELMSGLKKK